MGVYIKGMEMPTSCRACPLATRFFDGEDVCAMLGTYVHDRDREDDCPLVPVPEHGRLIDADAFTKRLKTELEIALPLFKTETWKERSCEMVNAIVGELEEMPTIIPAEEGET